MTLYSLALFNGMHLFGDVSFIALSRTANNSVWRRLAHCYLCATMPGNTVCYEFEFAAFLCALSKDCHENESRNDVVGVM